MLLEFMKFKRVFNPKFEFTLKKMVNSNKDGIYVEEFHTSQENEETS